MLSEIDKRKKHLDFLLAQSNKLNEDLEIQAHWARYLCVLTCGFVETSIRTIYSEYAKNKSAPSVSNFVENNLKQFQNPKMERILQLTRSFSVEWEASLSQATEGELKDSIDSIVANRHKIAHGESVGITIVRIERYYKDALKVIDLVKQQCGL